MYPSSEDVIVRIYNLTRYFLSTNMHIQAMLSETGNVQLILDQVHYR